MELSEAIDILERFDCTNCPFATCEQCEINNSDVIAIKTVLNELKISYNFADTGKMAEHFREDTKMIEPKECEHEWKNYTMYNPNTGESRDYRKCAKCGLEEDIEPTDNTTEKIEELDVKKYYITGLYTKNYDSDMAIEEIIDKLNEVIRKLNKEG